jgi:chemotaxis protein methyltransferase CheR
MTLAQSALIDRFRDLLSTRLHVSPSQSSPDQLARVLSDRVAALRTLSPERYIAMLGSATASSREWDELTAIMTVGESYFFRDGSLFAALRDQVLPELLQEQQGRLRVWSAGCSEGQELYSVAMLLHDMGAESARQELVGTDVNPAAVEAARRARYDTWSFRGVEPDLVTRHFAARDSHFELLPALRQGVTFHRHDLVNGSYPNPAAKLAAFDMILCRNVLIYFDPEAIEAVTGRLIECLRPGGYLVLGNAEVHSRQLQGVTPRLFGGRMLYQRDESGGQSSAAQPRRQATAATPLPTASGSPAPSLEDARELLASGDSAKAESHARTHASEAPDDAAAWVVVARACANQGKHDEARAACAAAIEADPFDADAHIVLAKVAEELGEISVAKERLRQAIYLDAGNADAHLTLASLYDKTGDARHASRAYRGALRAVEGDPTAADADAVAFIQRRIEDINA